MRLYVRGGCAFGQQAGDSGLAGAERVGVATWAHVWCVCGLENFNLQAWNRAFSDFRVEDFRVKRSRRGM